MPWYKQRVWQMGLGALMVLAGAVIVYLAASESVRTGLMWVGLVLLFLGLTVPLLTRIVEAQQEKDGERGEC